jgi:hypothetical protein
VFGIGLSFFAFFFVKNEASLSLKMLLINDNTPNNQNDSHHNRFVCFSVG